MGCHGVCQVCCYACVSTLSADCVVSGAFSRVERRIREGAEMGFAYCGGVWSAGGLEVRAVYW